jgi:hypothetical protein
MASLRTKLVKLLPDQPSIDGGPQDFAQPTGHLLCPSCGQIMQKKKIFPTYEHKLP